MKQENTNRLIHQKSPYLLQHAHNPVDWYPWGSEAFEAALSSGKPIFLSIGYATCHWCHVMEKESFENVEIAKLMNKVFINIKVDREELPYVDSLYMEFAQSMMSGAAGWPLNVLLTPNLQPFFAATYLPAKTAHGLMGMEDLILRIQEVWEGEEREKVLDQAARIVDVFAEGIHVKGDALPDKEIIEETFELLFKMSDPTYGGIRGAPKFTIGYQYNLMMHYSYTLKDGRALFIVERTLDRMHRGGIYDHLGGGFSRYSVDERWLVPHFEKMLYDNALLLFTYLEAWQITHNPLYKEVCQETTRYLMRDMRHSNGGFYSAEDADSEGHEGRFYTWTPQEIEQLLGKEEADLFAAFYGVTPEGNFEKRSILNMPLTLQEFASQRKLDANELDTRFRKDRELLWKAREARVHPFKDDKILTSWNGLLIFSLVQAGLSFEDPSLIQAAKNTANFIRQNLWKKGQLYRRWREGETSYRAGLDEHAALIRGLLALFEAGEGTHWLAWAMELSEILRKDFKADQGAFYQTDAQEENLILRKTLFSDGAEPSGNALQCENLLRLYNMTADMHYLNQAEDVLRAAKTFFEMYSPGYCYHLMNLVRYYDKQQPLIVIALNAQEEHLDELMKALYTQFIPHKCVIIKRHDDEELNTLLPKISGQVAQNGKTTFYICYEGVCTKPQTELNGMLEAIKGLK